MLANELFEQGIVAYRKYILDNPDPHLTHPYLTPESLVMDVGGYKGDWAARILETYHSNLEIFEPIFYDVLRERFADNDNVTVHPIALGSRDEFREITIDGDSSSFYIPGLTKRILVEDIASHFFSDVDLISLNVEGSEYPILSRLIGTNMISRYKNVQVQFHYTIPRAYEMREQIREELSETHEEQYCFPFVWESWRLKQ